MPIALIDLPAELLTRVVANIESQATLYDLARSSRQLYLFTIPHLYQSITIQEKTLIRNGQLLNLTSLLIRKPDLAGLVRHFTLHTVTLECGYFTPTVSSGESEYSEEPEGSEELKDSEDFEKYEDSEGGARPKHGKVDQALKTAVSTWNLPQEEENDWLRKLCSTRECFHDPILALLLPALPKVEKVVLDLGFGHDTHYLERMMERAVRKERPFDTGQPPFEALTVFTSPHNQFNKQKHSINFLACLLTLPAIQEISGGFKCNKNPVKIDCYSSSLTSLHLAAYAVSPADIGQVLHAPKALKTLSYTVCLLRIFKSAEIHHALRSQETQLESFTLDYNENYEDYFSVGTFRNVQELVYFSPIKTFLSFNRLKIFKIAALFLLTTENGANSNKLINFFPPGLELLHLTNFQARFEGLLEAVEHLLASKSSQHIPSLKRLILEESTSSAARGARLVMDVMWKDTKETTMERLSGLAAAQGVSFDVIEGSNNNNEKSFISQDSESSE